MPALRAFLPRSCPTRRTWAFPLTCPLWGQQCPGFVVLTVPANHRPNDPKGVIFI